MRRTSVDTLERRLLFASADLDNSFSDDGTQTTGFVDADENVDRGFAVAVQDDGKIVVVGHIDIEDEADLVGIARFTSTGELDTTFGEDQTGKVVLGFADHETSGTSVAIQSNGKILIGGQTSYVEGLDGDFLSAVGFVARLNSNGSIDSGFGDDGFVRLEIDGNDSIVNDIAIQADGRIVAAIDIALGSWLGIARLRASGNLDTDFADVGYTYFQGECDDGNTVNAIAVHDNGNIVIAGTGNDPTDPEGDNVDVTDFALFQFLPDGTPDDNFGGDGRAHHDFGTRSSDVIFDIAITPGGEIVAVGQADLNLSGDGAGIARFSSEGDLVDSDHFVIDMETEIFISVALQADQKIVTAGLLTNQVLIARYEADLTPDTTFNDGEHFVTTSIDGDGTDSIAYAVAIQSDGKILAAGESEGVYAVARYLAFDESAASISGTVFLDKNANGNQSAKDKPLAGIRVIANTDGQAGFDPDTDMNVLTDKTGAFTLPGLSPGDVRIKVIEPKATRATIDVKEFRRQTLDEGQQVTDLDYGVTRKVLISGIVFRDDDGDGIFDDDEPPRGNFTVFLDTDNDGALDEDELFDITGKKGLFSFDNLPAGTYVLRILDRDGFEATTPLILNIDLEQGQSNSDIQFGQELI